MKEKIRLLSILLVFLLLLVSCKREYTGYRPYDWNFYGVNKVHRICERVYDKSSRPKTITTYEFSKDGNILSIYDVSLSGVDSTGTIFNYNERNELVSVSTMRYIYSNRLDASGNLVREDYVTSTSSDGRKTGYYKEYKYNQRGQIIKKVSCEYDKEPFNTQYEYWDNGKMRSYEVTTVDGAKTVYDCDTLGNVVKKRVYSKRGNLRETYTTEYKYDSLNNWVAKNTYKNNRFFERVDRVNEYFARNINVDVKKAQYAKKVSDMDYLESVKYRLTHFGFTDKIPSSTLLWVILGLGLLFFVVFMSMWGANIFEGFLGKPDAGTGMMRTWVFNSNPYLRTLKLFGILLLSFALSFLVLIILGLLLWGLFWVIKIFFIILVWIGYATLALGVLGFFFSNKGAGCGSIVFGGIIVMLKDTLNSWGASLVGWAERFLYNLNLASWTYELVLNYWDVILLVVFLPLVLALSIAVIIMLVTVVLRGSEFLLVKAYNIRCSCPVCGAHEFEYLVGGEEHPVSLCPGIYGIFHQTSPKNGEKLPTMLLNGKARLPRKCKSCGSIINMHGENVMGTEAHIGIVGARGSGKSYLLYSALDILKESLADDFKQVDIAMGNRLEDNIERIKNNDGIQTVVRDQYRAVQVTLFTDNRSIIPYHLFFYDVAGETFNSQSLRSRSGMDFYKNVKSIIFVLDPMMADVSRSQCSETFTEWVKKRNKDNEKYDVDATITMCVSILLQAGRKTKDIDFFFVCSKGDLGYLEACGYPAMEVCDSDIVRQFLVNTMGLVNAVNEVENSFKSCSYAVVSTRPHKTTQLSAIMGTVLKGQGVNISL